MVTDTEMTNRRGVGMRRVLSISMYMLLTAPLAAAESNTTVWITPSTDVIELAPFTRVIEDPRGDRTIADVTADLAAFATPTGFDKGYTHSIFWLRLDFTSSDPETRELYLQFYKHTMASVDAWTYVRGTLTSQSRTGAAVPVANRELPFPRPTVAIKLVSGEPTTLILRIASDNRMSLLTTLLTPRVATRRDHIDTLVAGLYLGCLVGLMIYNLFLVIGTRDVSYLYYVFAMATMGLTIGALTGYSDLHLGTPPGGWAYFITPLGAITTVLIALFTRNFINIASTFPRANIVYQAIIVTNVTLIPFMLAPSTRFFALLAWINLLVPTMVAMATVAVVLVRRGYAVARYYLAAWSFMLVFLTLWIISFKGWIPDYLSYPIQLGSGLEAITMSLALAARITLLRDQAELGRIKGLESGRMRSLVHILCHDLVNPLAIVAGYAEIQRADEKRLDPKDRHAWDRTKKAVTSALAIIDHVRLREAIEIGKKRIKLGPVSLREIIDQARFLFQTKLEGKRLALVVTFDTEHEIEVEAEATGLGHNVMNNLLSNAIKFSREGATITIAAIEEDHGWLHLTVQDQGIGMPAALRSEVFSATKHTSRSGTNGESGTGFGMPLVKEYVEYFGGRIEVESWTEGERNDATSGTIIHIFLKIAKLRKTKKVVGM